MANWKELGEVPDSEDEDGLDSQGLQEAKPQPTIATRTKSNTKANSSAAANHERERDIWDFPDSEDDETGALQPDRPTISPPPTASEPLPVSSSPPAPEPFPVSSPPTAPEPCHVSSPLSPVPADDEVDALDLVGYDAEEIDTSIFQEADHEPPRFADEISTTFARIAAPITTKSTAVIQTPTPPRVQKQIATIQDRESGSHAELQEARQAAFRYERSLRPRKPIQQHPYLLENAQYSSVLREHGVKPVRMTMGAAQPQQEELPQNVDDDGDDDFEQESQNNGLPEVSDESQSNDLATILGANDELNDPLSSPQKTSPLLQNRAVTSSLPSSQSDTDDTSVLDQDLPDLDELLKSVKSLRQSNTAKFTKRKSLQPQSVTRKRRRRDTSHDDLHEPNEAAQADLSSPDPLFSPIPKLQFKPHSTPRTAIDRQPNTLASPLDQFTPLPRLSAPVIDISSEEENESQREDDPQEDQDTSETASDPESEKELVSSIGRRIRGVLPASWLRLDQQSGRDKVQLDVNKRQRHRSPEREMRRGVAQPKQTVAGSASTQVLFEDSEEETQQRTTNEVFLNQTKLSFEPLLDTELMGSLSSDDGGSVIEEDHIDRMVSGRKRQLRLSESFYEGGKRTKISNNPSKQHLRKVSKQQKITSHLQNTKSNVSSNRPKPQKRSRRTEKGRKPNRPQSTQGRGTKAHLLSPLRLGILDVIEPDAPGFLKIAARTAKQRVNQGRSSPRQKSIKLATRQDHIDAVSVLHEWRSGSIKQRPSVSATRQSKQRQRRQAQPRAESSGNGSITTRAPVALRNTSRKLTKHVSECGSVSYQADSSSLRPPKKRQVPAVGGLRQAHSMPLKPALLEVDETRRDAGFSFHSKKRILDRLFRKRDRGVSVAHSVASLETDFDLRTRASSPMEEPPERLPNDTKPREERPKISRFRKKTRPRQIDTEVPQYTHAADPLPVQYHPSFETGELPSEGKKLQGLGPYGTRYTHHFEIFPLDLTVYFHESTLIGSGVIGACVVDNLYLKMLDPRPRVSFNLGDQVLRWGPWNDQVSSELGIVFDFIAEQIEGDGSSSHLPHMSTAVDAANFVFKYVKDSLSLTEGATAVPFLARLRETLRSFINRMSSCVDRPLYGQHGQFDPTLRVYDRLLLVSFVALRICGGESSTLVAEKIQMEELLRSMARLIASTLFKLGFSGIKHIYDELNRSSYRERGLRDDATIIHCWSLLMRILSHVEIPRASFWDVIQTVMVSPETLCSVDARQHEHIWEFMFSLLPLVEFNDSGIVVHGKRHRVANDGWAIPQSLLKRVFQLYQENERQAPSFNNYCRALVGRCHYLVQQWGWRPSAPVVGVIFDFFGSRNLSHLRNEEVYKSPRFLDELAKEPSLDIEPEDRCFHIFLKLLALSIRKLRDAGSDNDIRNVITRTMPNHNRQYLQEQDVHERDLAALRNHHDLIGTLFWASPPKSRPGITLIERLVTPASSHKEACLINIRSWNQLARFIVASGEATTSFKPFSQWRSAFFQQTMQQFDSVATDIQQQLSSLSKDVSKSVGRDMVDAMISRNKAVAMEVLHLSVMASLDVMRHAPDLEAATFCLNTAQLQQVLRHFARDPPELDWAVLRTTLATLDSFLVKIDEFKANEESQESESQILNAAQADDAVLVVDHDLSRNYFSMARRVLSSQGKADLSVTATSDRDWCVEQTIVLSARMGMRFINGGLMRLSDMFKPGKYGLFDGLPRRLDLAQRRHLVLFLSTLLKHGLDNFSDAGFSLCEVWALSLVKPREYLEYENQLAEQLRRHGKEFVPDTVVGLSIRPDYNSNRDLFEFAISSMRKEIRDAGPVRRKILMEEYPKTLKLVMEQIQADLEAVSGDASRHENYVAFVRGIISLIGTYGSEMCNVDEFFFHIGKLYSPSTEDPQLRVAKMVSYGLRLQDGDARVAHQLFSLLFNNFKFALTQGKLQDDVDLLCRSMKNQHILGFVLGKMFPAIVRASFANSSAFPLLDVYVEALRRLLTGRVIAHELGEGDLPHVAVTLRATVDGMSKLCRNNEELSGSQVHVMRQATALLNFIWPSLYAFSLSHQQREGWTVATTALDHLTAFAKATIALDHPMVFAEAATALDHLMAFAETSRTYLKNLLDTDDSSMNPSLLLGGLRRSLVQPLEFDSHVNSFTKDIVDDVARNWLVKSDRIAIQTPGRARGTQANEQLVEIPVWNARGMAEDLYERIREWYWWWERVSGVSSSVEQSDDVLF